MIITVFELYFPTGFPFRIYFIFLYCFNVKERGNEGREDVKMGMKEIGNKEGTRNVQMVNWKKSGSHG